jgi:hypothetical protein
VEAVKKLLKIKQLENLEEIIDVTVLYFNSPAKKKNLKKYFVLIFLTFFIFLFSSHHLFGG